MPLGDTNRVEHFGSSLMTRFLYLFQVTIFSVCIFMTEHLPKLLNSIVQLSLTLCCLCFLMLTEHKLRRESLGFHCFLSALFHFSESHRLCLGLSQAWMCLCLPASVLLLTLSPLPKFFRVKVQKTFLIECLPSCFIIMFS